MAELRRAAEEKDALSDIDEAGDTARAAVGSRTPGNKESSSDDAEKVLPINLAELGVERCRKAGYFGEVGTNRVSSVTFDDVGGLDDYIRGLKEMVVLPLVYPEVCTGLGIKPPRGVLFHGPPGTGKTLLARALVQSCSDSSQRIAFFMCRGADILSKWVGEGERQLRVLFAQAQAFQPSIIFFDELDGLAPVRSARQEQAHASIVATLLALMDGIDDRGQVVVIGATNRPDSIDIALRRPGRFDREMLFRLPGNEARRRIIQIHTRRWAHKITAEEEKQLVDMTQGWGGADISALCTEAVLTALRRRYPQIYDSSQRLMVSVDNIKITMAD
ncbi:TAT-binding protein-like protein 7, AAA ATPase, partial [Linderina macrospora]